ncbi:MAG: M3 family oligoendopeptidase [Anaerolineae bacterium]|jgi:oligoendopeptidase F|nr:M3 family oligoendopeptidase [Anaerolineae bacterium]
MSNALLEQTGAEQVVWDLSVFYKGVDDTAISADMETTLEQADQFSATYKGRIARLDAEELIEALQTLEQIWDRLGRLNAFTGLTFATDTQNPKHGAILQKNSEFQAIAQQRLVFFDLEWNEVDDQQAAALLVRPELAPYRHYLEAERRYRPYQLSEIEEQLLLEKSVTGRSAWVRFFTQMTSALRYELDGQKLTQSQVMDKLRGEDRDLRHKAADAITAALRDRAMELTFIFNVLAMDKSNDDQRRGYKSWIASRNLSNKAPDAVVDALIDAVTGSYDLVQQHYQLKRKLLGVDHLYDYDRYAPIPVKQSETIYSWDEAKSIVLNAFYAFSPEMGDVAKRFFDENWIHAAPMPHKRSGAFASPTVPTAHPVIFLTYLGKVDNVMTLAHELGHGIHMYLSGQKHGVWGLHTPLTTAEMASVFAEMLVFRDLMNREQDPEVRLSMLANKIEDTFSTVYRQTAMNRFEDKLHNARRDEGELSTDRLSAFWMETQRAMFGDSVTLREDYGLWWSYIPHFLHTPGYVYAYAFGELLVLALYNLYLERGESFAPQYLEVLAAGDSDYPDRILAKVGLDLNDPGFWQNGVAAIRELVEQEIALARELGKI